MAPAGLAWLDYSENDQRRAREIVAMFSQRESRDELGIGRIRDALSDTLFPGTSFLLTRARYLLFVPWLYREGARRGNAGPKLTQWVEWNERQLIGALHRGGDRAGLIGRFAGAAVRDLPSSLYWNTLRRFGILRRDGTEGQVAGLRQISRPQDEATEFLEHSDAVWAPSIPPAPDDFFSYESCNFTLTHDEATWLAERIIDAVPESLLQFLVMRGKRHPDNTAYAWKDPEAAEAEGAVRDALDEARRFSVAVHGASLLYNLLLAERAEELGLSRYDGSRDRYITRLDEWQKDFQETNAGAWDLNRLWALVAVQGRPAALTTRSFVSEWVDLARAGTGTRLADDGDARELIRRRERQQKRGQARLINERLMRQWGGASGSDRLNFRWPVVRRILNEIIDGRDNGRAGT
ncbi:MAG: DUF6361 family protein [Chloroflexi bacterium]|nr:DUF6361 family protein [Chloroflexota bacterium]